MPPDRKRVREREIASFFADITLFLARLVELHLHLHLLETKCIPVLLYGLEACPLTKNQLSSIDFVVNRFFMKLFKSSNIAVVKECQKNVFFSVAE